MGPFRILAAATAIEICFGSAAVAALGAAGRASGWLDLFNCAAPFVAAAGVLGAGAALATLPKSRFRAVCTGAGLAAAAYGAAMTLPEAVSRLLPSRAAEGAPYRVVTANVFRENTVPFRAAVTLLARRADALIVEETSGSFEVAKPLLASAYGYSTDCPAAGVQIWLKTPILAQGCGMRTPPGSYRRWGDDFVWVRTLGPDGRPMVLASAHLGRPYPPRRQQVERRALGATMAALPPERLILAGDFNTVPWSFAMKDQDRLLKPLRRQTFWRPSFPAQINMLHRPWALPLLPIDHLYAGRAWSGFRLSRFRTPGSDHFAFQVDAKLR